MARLYKTQPRTALSLSFTTRTLVYAVPLQRLSPHNSPFAACRWMVTGAEPKSDGGTSAPSGRSFGFLVESGWSHLQPLSLEFPFPRQIQQNFSLFRRRGRLGQPKTLGAMGFAFF